MPNPFLKSGTLGKIAAYKSGTVVPSYERHMLPVKDLTERMFLLTAAYNLDSDKGLKPAFQLHIRPLIGRAPVMDTDSQYDDALGGYSHEGCFTGLDSPNLLVAAYAHGLTPDPQHFVDLPPSHFQGLGACRRLRGRSTTDRRTHP